jgi:CBS domain-containing protein
VNVGEIMAREFVMLSPTETLAEAAAKLSSQGVSGAPVVDATGKAVGLLSTSDILGHVRVVDKRFKILLPPEVPYGIGFSQEERERDAMAAFVDVASHPVESHMKREVPTVGPDATVGQALRVMMEGKVDQLPVVEDGTLLGMLSQGSLLGSMAVRARQPRLPGSP